MMLYAVVAVLNLVASCYLLFRRGNAIAPDITSPIRLRRWTGVFFTAMTLSHLWYMPSIYLTSSEDKMLCYDIGGMLDCMTTFPLAIVILITMLQDRRRPLWLAFVMVIPLVVILALNLGTHSEVLLPMFHAYLLLLAIGITIYMIREVRRYGCWLRDNYADLEHKEVWQSFVVLGITLMTLAFYGSGLLNIFYEFVVQLNNLLLIGLILWRVETLQKLDSNTEPTPIAEPTYIPSNIGKLLEQHCEATQLYLQHDLSLAHLSVAIGTNRTYLSSYFAQQGITYNIYINRLRIQHFVRLFRENVDKPQKLTAQQLAQSCGFTSYSTFSLAFKKFMRQTATAWMKEQNHHI